MIDYQEVGNRIRYYRNKRHITQEQLAFEIQTSPAYLSNIERATKKPSLQKLIEIAEVLDISIEDLLSPSFVEHEQSRENDRNAFFLGSDADKRRIVDNLYEIIHLFEQSR